MPKNTSTINKLDPFKVVLAKLLKSFPDTPPTKFYTAKNDNSLLEWNLQKGSLTG